MTLSGFLHHLFVRNFSLKLISLLLAVGLWFVVARDPIAEIETRVPIEFHNFPENIEIDSATFTEAQVRVRGPERLIRRLRPNDVHVEVSLSGVRPGQRTFDLGARQVRLPQDVDFVQVIPTQLQLSFDTLLTRTVMVRPRIIGTFASGLRIKQVTADPPSIAVSGPRRRVEALEAATTDPVDASGTVENATFVTQANALDPLIQVVHPTRIRVTVIMEREEGKKTE